MTDPFKDGIVASVDGIGHRILSHEHVETLYAAFKSRLMQECSVVERMTESEFDEWKKQMVMGEKK